MKRLIAITGVMLLSSAIFFVAVGAGAGPSSLPVKGRWSGIGYNVGQGNCPEGYQQNYAIGKGHMTLTGESEWFSEGCSNLATGNSEGNAVITASNGDLIFLTFNIQLSVPDAAGSGTWYQVTEITGGTGMFEGVTGGSGTSGGPYRFIGTIDVWSGTNEGDINF